MKAQADRFGTADPAGKKEAARRQQPREDVIIDYWNRVIDFDEIKPL
ncbi:MAG: hypothetical protein JO095_02030 [Alphaproteobacteria bacterium]|nr:hypothetical protein [Alphaproteobacteria bacterium]